MVAHTTKGRLRATRELVVNMGVQAFFEGSISIKNLLVAPMDKDPILKKEIWRDVQETSKGHSTQYLTIITSLVIIVTLENLSIVRREDLKFIRPMKEALDIRVNNLALH